MITMIKNILIYISLFINIVSCAQEKKENTIMATTNIKEKDIYDLYKTVEYYDNEIHYGIILSSSNCNFEILINDVKVLFYHDVAVGQVANGLYTPINQAIYNRGKQKIEIRLYPGLNKKTNKPEQELGNSHLSIDIVANTLKDGQSTDEETIFSWQAPTEPRKNRKDNIPWFSHPEMPYYEENTSFIAEVPYTVSKLENSQVLITKDNDSLKELTKEVFLFYSEMKTIYQKKDKAKLAEKVYEKEKVIAQQLYLTKDGIQNRWDDDYLVNFDSKKRKDFIMEPIENYKLVFYGNGRLVTLERIEQKYRGESALMSSYEEDGDEYNSHYDILLHRPKRNVKLEIR